MAANTSTVETELNQILLKTAKKLLIKNVDIQKDLISKMGDGIMGDVLSASLTDKSTNEVNAVVIKKAPSEKVHRDLCLIEAAYKNEIHFYSNLCAKIKDLSDLTPKYFVSEDKVGKEMIVLEDLTKKGYEVRSRYEPMNQDHIRSVFKAYGHFHAISFCFKNQNREEFAELIQPFVNIWKINASSHKFVQTYKELIETSITEALQQPEQEHLKQKLKAYTINFSKMLLDSINYGGAYGCVLHGDSWSSSFMFKYKNQEKTEVEDVKLIDFQVAGYGSPVHDLSHFLFIGAADSMENLNNLESLLDVYYETFSNTVQSFGKDPAILLPRNVLSADWKTYARSSMLLSMLLLKVKYASQDQIQEQSHTLRTDPNSLKGKKLINVDYNKELFSQKFVNILEHLYKLKAL